MIKNQITIIIKDMGSIKPFEFFMELLNYLDDTISLNLDNY